MRFKMAGKFKSKQASSRRGSVYNGRNALAKHIYTERSELMNTTPGDAQMSPNVIKPMHIRCAKLECQMAEENG